MWLGTGALVLSYGAYVSEVFRAGIESIHPSQLASADTLGLNRWQSMRYVILPQATRRVAPPLLNDFISLQKDTALLVGDLRLRGDVLGAGLRQLPLQLHARSWSRPCSSSRLTIPLTRYTDYLGAVPCERQFAGAR